MRDREHDEASEGKRRQRFQSARNRILRVVEEGYKNGHEEGVGGSQILQLHDAYGNRHVQRAIDGVRRVESGEEVPPDVEAAIEQARGKGRPLDSAVRAQMEPFFGADFDGVRVHADFRADRLNRALHAGAFTTNQNIFFRQGQYNPGTIRGRELLAHELTHVVQQSRSIIQCKLSVGWPVDRYEQQAEQVSHAFSDIDRQLEWRQSDENTLCRQEMKKSTQTIDIEEIIDEMDPRDLRDAVEIYNQFAKTMTNPEDKILDLLKKCGAKVEEIEEPFRGLLRKHKSKAIEKLKEIRAIRFLLKLAPYVELLEAILDMGNIGKSADFMAFVDDPIDAIKIWNARVGHISQARYLVIVRDNKLVRQEVSTQEETEIDSETGLRRRWDYVKFHPQDFFLKLSPAIKSRVGLQLGKSRRLGSNSWRNYQETMVETMSQVFIVLKEAIEAIMRLAPTIEKIYKNVVSSVEQLEKLPGNIIPL